MTEAIRSSFLVYLVGEETQAMIHLRMEMIKAGFHLLNFRRIELAYDRIAKNPPHLVVVDFDAQALTAEQYLEKFSKLTPETLHIAFLGENRTMQSDALVEMGFYAIISKSNKSFGSAVSILDRALERLYLQYQGEQISEQSQKRIQELEAAIQEKNAKLSADAEMQAQLEGQVEEIADKLRSHQLKINQLEAEVEATESKTQRYISEFVRVKNEKEALEEEIKRYRGERGTSNVSFTGLVQSLNRCHSVDEAVQDWLNKIEQLYQDTSVAFFRYIPGHSHLVLNQCAGLDIEKVRGIGIPLSGLSPREQKSFYSHVRFVANMRDLLKGAFNISDFEFRELVTDRGVIGICVLFKALNSDTEKRFFGDSIELLNLVCHKNSLAFRIHDCDTKDELTQLLSGRTIDSVLQSEMSRANRTNLPLSALYIRVDNFADHERLLDVDSERILRAVATILKKTSRLNDLLFRIEKDQFVALLPNTNHNGAALKAEALRKMIEKAQIKNASGESIPGVHLSIGVSEYPTACKDADGLLMSADEALYEAIRGGGNQVHLATMIDETPSRKFLSPAIFERML